MIIQVAKSDEYASQLCDLMTSVLNEIERSLSHSTNLIEVYDVPESHQTDIQAWLGGYLELTPIASVPSIPADNTTQSIITVSGLASFHITIWLNEAILPDWNDALIPDGSAEFKTNTSGIYIFGIRDGFNIGFVQVTATEF